MVKKNEVALLPARETEEKREQGIVSMAEPQSTKEPSYTKAL